uniref:Cilia- and flagella-associated protein 46 isoform X7 n=1 Tax=Geotrypetes seraphini TaxID=260995 RepID=A0A6P8QHC1_GEOSA|nr:cilia- and flagella-associated protein 46 isoform X7 [Geotrypetes seraphini]
MDLVIKQLLSAAHRDQDVHALQKAYDMMKAAEINKNAVDKFESFNLDLYVLCAEQAIQLGQKEIGKDCLDMYFKGKPIQNQFLGRAYVCQGQLYLDQSSANMETFEKSSMFFLKAAEFAKPQPRYHFLIYNASILYWQSTRPFLRPGYRHLLIPSLSQILKALEEIQEEDHDWRAMLMIELLECLLDGKKRKAAIEYATNSAAYIKHQAAHLYPKFFSFMVRHDLIDSTDAAKEAESSHFLTVSYKIQRLKLNLESGEPVKEYITQLQEIYEMLTYQSGKEPLNISASERVSLLLDLTHLSLEMKCTKIAIACIRNLKDADITDSSKEIEIESLECICEIQKLGSKISSYSKSSIETQLKAIERLEIALQNAVRLEDPSIAQMVCVALWNLCLPLMQQNLRKQIKKPLQFVAEILEKIDSVLYMLRCQVHIEVAQMEEDEGRLEVAMKHFKKALSLDHNKQYQNLLQMAFHRLQLQIHLYKKPDSPDDKAALIIEQAKKVIPNESVSKKRPLLVKAGLALAPDEFQIVLDSENEPKASAGKDYKGPLSHLCLKALHHSKCVEKVDGHFKRLEDKKNIRRVYLWAELAKVAQKRKVWDVCRAACRFCLLYDDGQWKLQTSDIPRRRKRQKSMTASDIQSAQVLFFGYERDLLRILAEIRFINAEAIINLLKSEGVQLNEHAILPEDKSKHAVGFIPKYTEQDPEWIIYSNWIKQLSQYATENFERAAELSVELNEALFSHNAMVYVLNYNRHLITAGRQKELVHILKILFNAVQRTGYNEDTILVVMLCNALAQGLIHTWLPTSANKYAEVEPQTEKGKKKKGTAKGLEKTTALQILLVDPNGLPDVKMALEVSEYAMDLINERMSEEVIPLGVQQQIIATWVKAKQLCQQQIGQKLGTDEQTSDGQNLTSRVLVAVEMHACNGLGFMDFTVPSLAQVMKMASECNWSDPMVELQTLTRLANFAYKSHDYDLAITCSQKALQLDNIAKKTLKMNKHKKRTYKMAKEMLSTAACIQGQSMMDHMTGKNRLLPTALKVFETSARYGGEAESNQLVMLAAKHFWNACSTLRGSPEERKTLKHSIVSILKAVVSTYSKKIQVSEKDVAPLHIWPTKDVHINDVASDFFGTDGVSGDDDIKVIVALYELLYQIYADNKQWKKGLIVLDEAIRILPKTKHRLGIFKHRVLVKARLGRNFMMDIMKFKDEGEDCVSNMWRQVAFTSRDIMGQLLGYKNAIEALQKPENEWQKVEYLMEVAIWLYCIQFPVSNALNLLDWAVDILLQMNLPYVADEDGKIAKEKSKLGYKPSGKDQFKVELKLSDMEKDVKSESLLVKQSLTSDDLAMTAPNIMENLQHIRQLETLVRAHTLMAIISGHHSPHHLEHCLGAYSCIMLIWQVALPAAVSFIKTLLKNALPAETGKPQSPPSKKGKGKKEAKIVPSSPKDKNKRKVPLDILPGNIEEWASYECPEEVREAFKSDASSCSINRANILEPMNSLYYLDLLVKELQSISLIHLTIPVLQLAELIASGIVESKSLSELYRLRLAQTCADLKLSNSASYHETMAGTVFIYEQEQASSRQEISLLKEKMRKTKMMESKDIFQQAQDVLSPVKKLVNSNEKIMELDASGKGISVQSFPYLWIAKAEVLIQLGFYQPARQLLAEAHKTCQQMDDKYAVSKCLYLLAVLANKENNHGQAKILSEEAQQIEGDAEFCYKNTLNFSEAVLGGEKDGKEKLACSILKNTINVLTSMISNNSNKESELRFFIASLKTRRILIQLQLAQNSTEISFGPSQLVIMLLEACDKMSQIEEDFLQCGHQECSVEVIMHQAYIQRMLTRHTEDEDRKHRHYLDAYALAQRAVCAQEELLYNIQSLFTLHEIKNISLPAMRILANMKLSLVELSLEMLDLVCVEKSKKDLEDERKGSLCKLVEDFVRSTPDDTSLEQEWITTQRTLGHTILAHLDSLVTLSIGCADLKGKALYLIGKCLRLLAVKVDPLTQELWWKENIQEAPQSKPDYSVSDEDFEEEENEELERNSFLKFLLLKQHRKFIKKADILRKWRSMAQIYFAHASEVLLQSMNVAMNNDITGTLGAASLEMVLCIGRFDPLPASQYLALHQSCSASVMMKNILLQATFNTSSSQLAALLQLQHHLKEQGDMTSSFLKNVEQRMTDTSKAWENLSIHPQHLSLGNELPSYFNMVILQHSEDRSFLYGSILERPKSNGGPKAKVVPQDTRVKVCRSAVDPDVLYELLEKMKHYKQKMMQLLYKKNYQKNATIKSVHELLQENRQETDTLCMLIVS